MTDPTDDQAELLSTLNRIAAALERLLEQQSVRPRTSNADDPLAPRSDRRQSVSPRSTEVARQSVSSIETTDSVEEQLADIRRLLVEQQRGQAKEWYEAKEAAHLTGFKPYTIRQACNLGRIKPDWLRKDPRTGRWRIHHDAVQWIRNHGLPPRRR
jgi:hypothetical protein